MFKKWYFWLIVSLSFMYSIIIDPSSNLFLSEYIGFFIGSLIITSIIF